MPVQGDDAQQIEQQTSADRIGVGFKEGGVEILSMIRWRDGAFFKDTRG